MRVSIITLLIFISFIGCTNKSVKLPVLNVAGIQDTIYNNSQIWLFFNEDSEEKMVKLNKNNTISTTNWIFNIDRRLSLELVIPEVKTLLEKREKPALHESDEPVYNYFSYVDTVSNKLSMIRLDSVQYITGENINVNVLQNDKLVKNILLNYKISGLYANDSLISINDFNTYLEHQPDSVKIKLYLRFDKNVLYRDYVHLKAILQNNKSPLLQIDNKEFIDLE